MPKNNAVLKISRSLPINMKKIFEEKLKDLLICLKMSITKVIKQITFAT